MRICRYVHPDDRSPQWGAVDGDQVRSLHGDPYAGDVESGDQVAALSEVKLLAPCTPSKVVCAGRNYRSLLAEQQREIPSEPFLFLKSSTAVTGPGAPIWYPDGVDDVAHEGELAVVVGRQASGLSEEEAMSAVVGYTCANDITVRDWQHPSVQWWRAKSADSHCPLGPWIDTDVTHPDNLRVRTLVNGEVRQDGSTDDLVFSIPQLLAHISAHVTLLPGDVVLTGTAAGIRPVAIGDEVQIEIDGIGTLTNPVHPWPTGRGNSTEGTP